MDIRQVQAPHCLISKSACIMLNTKVFKTWSVCVCVFHFNQRRLVHKGVSYINTTMAQPMTSEMSQPSLCYNCHWQKGGIQFQHCRFNLVRRQLMKASFNNCHDVVICWATRKHSQSTDFCQSWKSPPYVNISGQTYVRVYDGDIFDLFWLSIQCIICGIQRKTTKRNWSKPKIV